MSRTHRKRRLKPPPKELSFFLAVMVAAAFVGILIYILLDSTNARDSAFSALKGQAAQNLAQRQAATRRIDILNKQIDSITAENKQLQRDIGKQSQAISDLIAQVKAAGGTPVVKSPASILSTATKVSTAKGSTPTSSSASSTPAVGSSGSHQTSGSTPAPQPTSSTSRTPAPQPSPSPKPSSSPTSHPVISVPTACVAKLVCL